MIDGSGVTISPAVGYGVTSSGYIMDPAGVHNITAEDEAPKLYDDFLRWLKKRMTIFLNILTYKSY